MAQQVWTITFNDEEVSKGEQAELFKEFLQNALPEIYVSRKTNSDYTQNGDWVDLVMKLVGPGGVVIAVIGAITAYLKSTHGASMNIEIKEGKIKKYEVKNVTAKTIREVSNTIVQTLEKSSSEEQEGMK